MLFLHRTRNPFLSSAWITHSSLTSAEGEDNDLSFGDGDAENVRGRIEEAYHDDLSPGSGGQAASSRIEGTGASGSDPRGPVVQPSRLHDEENEWRED